MSENNGMITKIWGPPAWIFLHCVVMGYPVQFDPEDSDHVYRRKGMKKFFKFITCVLPCKYCRESYNKYIKESPIENHLSSRVELARWLYDIHNKVNYKLGIPLCDIPEFIEVYNRYEQYRAKCTITSETTSKERDENIQKGCTIPEDGIPKNCTIEIKNKHGKKIHDCNKKPEIAHDILIEFYKGNTTAINSSGINELLDMDLQNICTNFRLLYLVFPQIESGPLKVPLLDSQLIEVMKNDPLIQENLIKSINKVLESLDSCINIISHMLTTIMLIGDQQLALNIVKDLQLKYNTQQNFRNLIDEFSYNNILDEWNTIITL